MKAKVLIFGASSRVGQSLVELLKNYDVYCVTRSDTCTDNKAGFKVIQHDLTSQKWTYPITQFEFCIFCADSSLINYLPSNLVFRDLIFISSASRILKANSEDQHDKELVSELSIAEDCVEKFSGSWTIVRPTWIFDGVDDKITRTYVKLARKLKIFPFIWKPLGKRNPIDSRTLAHVILLLMQNIPLRTKRIFNVGGYRCFEYDKIVSRILNVHNVSYISLYLPLTFYLLMIRFLHSIGLMQSIHGYMFKHMKVDLNIDNSVLPESLQEVIRVNSTKFWKSYDKT